MLPIFFPTAVSVAVLQPGTRFTLRELCRRAGVRCRVSGPPAKREIRVAPSRNLVAMCLPGPLSPVWLGIPRGRGDRMKLALGLLAYGVFDYGARETLRGIPAGRPGFGPGRPRSGRALSTRERQRRFRARRP